MDFEMTVDRWVRLLEAGEITRSQFESPKKNGLVIVVIGGHVLLNPLLHEEDRRPMLIVHGQENADYIAENVKEIAERLPEEYGE